MTPATLDMLKRIAKGIVKVFGSRCEAVIHDFADLSHSLIHIEGDVTQRKPGAPATNTLMRMLKEFGDPVPDKLGYKITTKDGKVLRCATMFVRDAEGRLEGCLAINFNITDFVYLSRAFDDFTFMPGIANGQGSGDTVVDFSAKPSESMEQIIDATVVAQGKAPASMDKAEKKEIVAKLDHAGIFMIKGSVNYLAKVFGASRYTIYNYLKEVRGD